MEIKEIKNLINELMKIYKKFDSLYKKQNNKTFNDEEKKKSDSLFKEIKTTINKIDKEIKSIKKANPQIENIKEFTEFADLVEENKKAIEIECLLNDEMQALKPKFELLEIKYNTERKPNIKILENYKIEPTKYDIKQNVKFIEFNKYEQNYMYDIISLLIQNPFRSISQKETNKIIGTNENNRHETKEQKERMAELEKIAQKSKFEIVDDKNNVIFNANNFIDTLWENKKDGSKELHFSFNANIFKMIYKQQLIYNQKETSEKWLNITTNGKQTKGKHALYNIKTWLQNKIENLDDKDKINISYENLINNELDEFITIDEKKRAIEHINNILEQAKKEKIIKYKIIKKATKLKSIIEIEKNEL